MRAVDVGCNRALKNTKYSGVQAVNFKSSWKYMLYLPTERGIVLFFIPRPKRTKNFDVHVGQSEPGNGRKKYSPRKQNTPALITSVGEFLYRDSSNTCMKECLLLCVINHSENNLLESWCQIFILEILFTTKLFSNIDSKIFLK